jgi:hypothetical protein
VPWCPTCDRFLSPSTVHHDGTCPTCGRTVEPGHAHTTTAVDPNTPDKPTDRDDALDPVPWHFKLMLGALAIYLGYRAFQGIEWVANHL